MERVIGPDGKLVLSLGTADTEGSPGEDLRAAFTYVEKDYNRLSFLGTELRSVGGNQETLFSG